MALPVADFHLRSSAGSLPIAFAMARTWPCTEPQHDPM
jgi:hypothetical protein